VSKQMEVYQFGERLLDTLDLDPVYVILWDSDLDDGEMKRWLVAYWCFYHMGTASWIASGGIDYWDRMKLAASSREYLRNRERRHFRGGLAEKSVAYLSSRGLDDLFNPLISDSPKPLTEVMRSVQDWVGFGPWIGFKIADMLECLQLCPVVFDSASVFLFDSPRAGAEEMWTRYGKGERPEDVGGWALAGILAHLGSRVSPPGGFRDVGVQEAETVLCKWKSYLGGHYTIGEDVEGTRRDLLRYSKTKMSQRLLKAGERGGLW